MSLPARPNVGLPSTPRARSFNTGAARQSDYPPRPRSSASERPPPPSSYAPPPLPTQARTLRPQKSLNSLPSAPRPNVRSRSLDRKADPRPTSSRSEPPPPLPGLPTSRRIGRAPTQRVIGDGRRPVRSADDYPYRTRTSEDVMSDSSSGASELSMSPSSVASSRTSLDEGEGEEKGDGKPTMGHGSSLWTSITSVASNLTISVSKAWSTNVATYSGEETPVGGESRLTRAMKAYHISKARDPSDLPEWLFDERERGVRSHLTSSNAPPAVEDRAPEPKTMELSRPRPTIQWDDAPPRIARGPTLADRRAAGGAAGGGSEEHVTKSMARLRALRDAKRNAKVRFHGNDDGDGDEEGGNEAPAPAPFPTRVPAAPTPFPRTPSNSNPVSRESPTRPMRMPAPLGGVPAGVRGRQPSMRVGLPSGVRPLRA
ncbi:hypothetical protein C8Q73DRAFT_742891 [Cubamyces lactineus]|nr:hypothetical protein C8Q73DRAFT_742891 [Cubamyces lactineus]